MRTTRSQAQEETYSSSGDSEEADSASEPEGSELESSPVSSVKPSEQQVCQHGSVIKLGRLAVLTHCHVVVDGCIHCSMAEVTSIGLAAQDMESGSDEEHQSASNSGSHHGSAGLENAATKTRKDRASVARHIKSSRDSSSRRGGSAVLQTTAVEGRKRLRKAS